MTVRVCAVPRCPDAPAEYEDAVFPAEGFDAADFGGAERRFAVADGATTSSFSGNWARLLVGAWANGSLGAGGEALPDLSRRWRDAVDLDGLPWFAADKLRDGSHAALIGLVLRPGGAWEALVVGDCCLFQVRDDTLIEALPDRAETLDGRPMLVGTQGGLAEWERVVHVRSGHWQAGDALYLMSDALSRWFLASALTRQSAPWRVLEVAAERPETFAALIQRLRESRTLQTDDVSLVRISL